MQIILKNPYEKSISKIHYRKSSCIPGQDFSIADLLIRFTNGQRLNVNMHIPSPEEDRIADLEMKDEDLIAPIYEDIVDFEAANEAHQANKAEFAKRKREERERNERQRASEPKKDTPNKDIDQ